MSFDNSMTGILFSYKKLSKLYLVQKRLFDDKVKVLYEM